MKHKIYVASSWRNKEQPMVVDILRNMSHEVYDFKNPKKGSKGFSWSQVREDYLKWTPEEYVRILLDKDNHRIHEGFKLDMDALKWCDTCILLLPCGRSAHLEAGWCIGQGKPTAVYISKEKFEPDLMYLMANLVTTDISKIYKWINN